ncbi:MAG: DUF1540 domain-containing protein [Bacillota bacterium]|nr:DUF1540 domain-containing protein [Bacillota bacterium]
MAREIDCEAKECLHNGLGKCTASIIQVRGGATYSRKKTYCNTHTDKTDSFMITAIEHMKGNADYGVGDGAAYETAGPLTEFPATPISCTAIKCRHNQNYLCSAKDIQMNRSARGVSCGTFDA